MTKNMNFPEGAALHTHQEQIAKERMQTWFVEDPQRFSRFSLAVDNILVDYSKNWIQPETIQLLCQLAHAANLPAKIDALFTGKPINTTESRPALHTALRSKQANTLFVDERDIFPIIQSALGKMRQFVDQVRNQNWLGSTGKPITDIVNIGIGGSHLGPLLTTQALADIHQHNLRCHFVSNVDAAHLHETLQQLPAETTLFIVSSKSFTTLETLTNAQTIKTWLQQQLGISAIANHFVAVTANNKQAMAFGIPETQIFPLWEWVGGRYSIWSAIGLPLALMIGMDHFEAFLEGAHAMDLHFRSAPFSENMPALLGLLGIWYINFFGAMSHAVVPYSHYLTRLPAYLQQADMESNGKRISHAGQLLDYSTGPILWGEQGCNGQHAFHQLLHQGQHLIPVDFILVGNSDPKNLLTGSQDHHDILIASGLSQAQALLQGRSYEAALTELRAAGHSEEKAHVLAQHKVVPGNRPSNVIFMSEVSPYNLGALLALYEHKIFVQSVIWDINPFDQWGVELGKQLLPQILADLKNPLHSAQHDASTQGLIEHYKKIKELA